MLGCFEDLAFGLPGLFVPCISLHGEFVLPVVDLEFPLKMSEIVLLIFQSDPADNLPHLLKGARFPAF